MQNTHSKLGDRSLFPDLRARAYLNHGAISPPSTLVRQAVQQVLSDYARGGVWGFKEWLPRREALRGSFAELIGAEATDIALIPNTTTGVAAIANCIDWQPGDHVLTFSGEFPSNVTPWQVAAKNFGVELELLPLAPMMRSVDEGIAALRSKVRDRTRLIAISAVQFQNGLRMPLGPIAAVAREAGAELFVDAVQGCGAVPIDVGVGVDYLTCGGHKWLMGLEGAGFLYARQTVAEKLVPRTAGWLSHEDALSFLFHGPGHLRYDRPIRKTIDFVELGAQSAVGYAAVGASLGLIASLGVEAIYAHVNTYLDLLEPRLVALGFESLRRSDEARRSGILALSPPADVDITALYAAVDEREVACTIPDGNLRFAPHWPNAFSEVPVVADAIENALRLTRTTT